jgi:hypothetical protein
MRLNPSLPEKFMNNLLSFYHSYNLDRYEDEQERNMYFNASIFHLMLNYGHQQAVL